MGLLSMLASAIEPEVEVPSGVAAINQPNVVCAPATGRVRSLADLPDAVFAQGMLGWGLAVVATDGVVYAPVSGVVTADVKTRHALLIHSANGADVLLHVGLDSVRLQGQGFTDFVHKGDEVAVGDPVIKFDLELLHERGLDASVVVTVSNPEVFGAMHCACGNTVEAGAPLFVFEV